MSDEITYGSYLELDALLGLQRPRSHPEHPDELLFIIVHQASELWFKAILHDIEGLITALEGREAGQALWRLQRLNALMRIVSAQLSSLETLPPQHFAQFRTFLGTSSGSQSVQFRAIEAASGLRDQHFMRALEEHGEIPPLVRAALARPTLQDLFLKLLDAAGVTLEDLYLGPGPTVLFFLAEALLEYEQQFAQWRFKHVQLVERIIGPSTGGTGGTLGSRYLMRTVDQRFFPVLWETRGRLFGLK
ncbi:MAG TPA: tryptophan 2,3-dioxygenase family protein [Gemmatimonadaceae bacterium]